MGNCKARRERCTLYQSLLNGITSSDRLVFGFLQVFAYKFRILLPSTRCVTVPHRLAHPVGQPPALLYFFFFSPLCRFLFAVHRIEWNSLKASAESMA